jgi:hypothetical protein
VVLRGPREEPAALDEIGVEMMFGGGNGNHVAPFFRIAICPA